MTGNIAQLIALVSHGNNYLKTGELEHTFFPENSTFQFCNNVSFRISAKKRFFFKGSVSVLANNPNEWFKVLRETNCKRLCFRYQHSIDQSFAADYMLAGLNGGGGSWFIEAEFREHSTYWSSLWDATDLQRADNKIWLVAYVSSGLKEKKGIQDLEMRNYGDRLQHVLAEITAFASAEGLVVWAEQFDKALATLKSDDLLADSLHSLESRRLIFAAGKAWVFGGMGSWNDLGGFENVEKDHRYKILSAELFESINNVLERNI